MFVREFFCKKGSNDGKVNNRLLIRCPLSDKCGRKDLWLYHKSFLRHLQDVYFLSLIESRQKFQEAINSAIQEITDDNFNSKVVPFNDILACLDEDYDTFDKSINISNPLSIASINFPKEMEYDFTGLNSIKKNILVIDIETTDLMKDSLISDLTELCIVNLLNVRELTQIDAKVLQNAPELEQVLQDFISEIGNEKTFFIANNGSRFDFKVLTYHLACHNLSFPETVIMIDSIDILKKYKTLMPISNTNRALFNQDDVYRHLFNKK
ncbi:hypothetical protein ABK040_003315 [Willaertia magna]